MPSVRGKNAATQKEGGVQPTVIELGAMNNTVPDLKATGPNWSISQHIEEWPPRPPAPMLPAACSFACLGATSDLYVRLELLETRGEHQTLPLPNAGSDFEIPSDCRPSGKFNLKGREIEDCHLRVILYDDDWGDDRLLGYCGKVDLAPLVRNGQRFVEVPTEQDGDFTGFVYLELRALDVKDQGRTLAFRVLGCGQVDNMAPSPECSFQKLLIAVGVTGYILIYAGVMYMVEGDECEDGLYNDFNNCLWFVLVTFSSVGYGDTYPCTDTGRIVNGIFIILNQLTLAWFFNVAIHVAMINMKLFKGGYSVFWKIILDNCGLCRSCQLLGQKFMAGQMVLTRDGGGDMRIAQVEDVRQQFDKIEGAIDYSYRIIWEDGSGGEWRLENELRDYNPLTFERLRSELIHQLLTQGFVNGLLIVLGTVVIYYTEKDEPGWTGENDELTMANTFHFAVVTMSTVGYGDWAPTSVAGQTFCSFYILIGVTMLANFATIVIEYFMKRNELLNSWEFLNSSLVGPQQILKFDTNGDAQVDKYEYLVRALLECDFVAEDKIDLIMNKFHNIDVDKSGTIDLKDFAEYENFLKKKRQQHLD